jgi:hypothetical protein
MAFQALLRVQDFTGHNCLEQLLMHLPQKIPLI